MSCGGRHGRRGAAGSELTDQGMGVPDDQACIALGRSVADAIPPTRCTCMHAVLDKHAPGSTENMQTHPLNKCLHGPANSASTVAITATRSLPLTVS